ncbi:MAG: hypothetical protein K940chlam5_00729 [Candidatus Anoxychlamydiales bacterium]|nr:hypothetical protein [Candidatus Anoxychlamydiales bacterium]
MSSFSILSPSTWLSKSADKPVLASSSTSSPASPATKAPTPLGTTSTIAPAPSAGDPTSVTAPSVSTSATPSSEPTKENIYLITLKECFTKPDKTVLKHPIKSTVYHVAIQVLFYSVAQSFPVFGSIVIAFSVALFERVVVLNPKKYGNAILASLKDAWKYITSKWSKNKPAAPVPASTSSSSSATPSPATSDSPPAADRPIASID